VITVKDSQQKPQGSAAKANVSCLSGDQHRRLATEATRIRSKSKLKLFVRRSPHDRSRKDLQQKQTSVVCQAITAEDSQQNPQGSAAKGNVNCCNVKCDVM